DLPVSLWMADEAGTPYFGIIQPALGFDSEVLSARNLRESDRFRAYCERADQGDFRRGIAIFGITEASTANALARVRSRRPGNSDAANRGPSAAPARGPGHWLRRILARLGLGR